MLKNFSKKILMGLTCSSLLAFSSMPVFASTNVSATGKAAYTPTSTSISKASIGSTITSPIITLNDIVLTTLTNVDGKTLTAGDTSDLFYAGYTATDISGKPTTNYDLIAQGLILTGDHMLTTSSPNVVAQLVKDTTDSTKALIKVTATSDTISMDLPVVITAITVTGKISELNTILKKQPSVDLFTFQGTSESIASGRSKVIPFIALDQNGKAITKFSELNGIITLIGATFKENLDGTASVINNKVYNTGTAPIPVVISAITPTGRYSSIIINIYSRR